MTAAPPSIIETTSPLTPEQEGRMTATPPAPEAIPDDRLPDAEFRLECLRLALQSHDPIEGRPAEARHVVECAEIFMAFVRGEPGGPGDA